MRPLTVLATGAGGTYGLATIRNLRRSALPLRIIGADVTWHAPGMFLADVAALLPRVDSKNFDDELAALSRREKVDAIFLTSGTEIAHVVARREELESKTGATLIVNSKHVFDLASDKLETARRIAQWGLAAPMTGDLSADDDVLKLIHGVGFPLIAKPRYGSGSKGLMLISNESEIYTIRQTKEPYVIQEHIGDLDHEYTVGVVGAEDGRVFGSIVLRRWLKAGQTVACESVDEPAIAAYAEAITEKVKPRGYLNVQLRLRGNQPCAFELNARVSSSTGFRGAAGFNEPEMILRSLLLDETPLRPSYRKVRMIRFSSEEVVDDARWEALASLSQR